VVVQGVLWDELTDKVMDEIETEEEKLATYVILQEERVL
jgi:hypothetical protein